MPFRLPSNSSFIQSNPSPPLFPSPGREKEWAFNFLPQSLKSTTSFASPHNYSCFPLKNAGAKSNYSNIKLISICETQFASKPVIPCLLLTRLVAILGDWVLRYCRGSSTIQYNIDRWACARACTHTQARLPVFPVSAPAPAPSPAPAPAPARPLCEARLSAFRGIPMIKGATSTGPGFSKI